MQLELCPHAHTDAHTVAPSTDRQTPSQLDQPEPVGTEACLTVP